MPNRPPDVALNQIDDPDGGRGKTKNTQTVVYKDSGDLGSGQQVVHIVIGLGQIGHLGLQLGIDCRQFLIN